MIHLSEVYSSPLSGGIYEGKITGWQDSEELTAAVQNVSAFIYGLNLDTATNNRLVELLSTMMSAARTSYGAEGMALLLGDDGPLVLDILARNGETRSAGDRLADRGGEDTAPRDFSSDIDIMGRILADVLDRDRPLTEGERELVLRMMRGAFTLGVLSRDSADG